MEIDENRQYFRLLLTLIDFPRARPFFVVIDANLFILLPTIINNYSRQSIPIDYPIDSLDPTYLNPKTKKTQVCCLE